MDPETSVILGEIRDRYNQVIMERTGAETPDAQEIENDIIEDPGIVPPSVLTEIKNRCPRMLGVRTRTLRDVRDNIAEAWGDALSEFDRCLALADLIFARLSRAIFSNGDTLRRKDPRPLPDRVTGAYVKCLLLLGLYGKSCGIATEITSLLRDGLPDAALSRLRTLHEHLVIIAVLHNDHTYEISEKYEDCSVFESLKQLKANQQAASDPAWQVPEGYVAELQQKITEVENLAQEIIARRGAVIRKQYEWARQALPQPKRDNPRYRITFADLEQAVGMESFRDTYLTGNDRIHAGSYSAINHLNLAKPWIPQSRPRCDDWAISLAGGRTALLLSYVARAVGKSIAWETEEYDEFLYVCEFYRAAHGTVDGFVSAASSPPFS